MKSIAMLLLVPFPQSEYGGLITMIAKMIKKHLTSLPKMNWTENEHIINLCQTSLMPLN